MLETVARTAMAILASTSALVMMPPFQRMAGSIATKPSGGDFGKKTMVAARRQCRKGSEGDIWRHLKRGGNAGLRPKAYTCTSCIDVYMCSI